MGGPALLVERTVEQMPLARVKPLPPKAVAGGAGYTRAGVPGYNRHRRTHGLKFKTTRSRQASCRPLHYPFEFERSLRIVLAEARFRSPLE
jgi:hypothetical protein